MNAQPAQRMEPNEIISLLEKDGIAILPDFVPAKSLVTMQQIFARMLKRMRWNDFNGYEKTEPYRHMIPDILTLAEGFVDAALDPMVKNALRSYIGPQYVLAEAKGWLSLPTAVDFNGWHGDCWYDRDEIRDTVPREVKLGIYLTDVKSGAFNYIKGTHGKMPRNRVADAEVAKFDAHDLVEVYGKAGTAFLFDTSGIHRQAVPILEPRQAVFYCFHEPHIPLQKEDVAYYRYHPLLLNAAFLGKRSAEDYRVLAFGDKTNYLPGFERNPRHEIFQKCFSAAFNVKLRGDRLWHRVRDKIKRILSGR